ncbi:amino acid racemase [uncultured Aquimarina sp.]|uniref:aspartate/glutamate racemase family protein n=1 Tax=uncultured Aquimarina sp. TaxID=575652 RepID=UPI0026146E0B|nr:amino acid racemase [uncultured Aquimarina sp.]
MLEKKKLGVISGMGTRAGLFFLNKLTESIDAPKDQDFPEFIVHNNSKIPDRTLAIVYGEKSPKTELLRSINMMRQQEVDYIVSTCVTSYHFINKLEDHLKKNILDPVDLVYTTINNDFNDIKRVGLLATTGTINSSLFHEKFHNSRFELVTLDAYEQEEKFMRSVYMEGGLKSAQISNKAYDLFQDAVNGLKEKSVDLIIGGCTEVQIGYSKTKETIPYIDAVDVLVDEVIYKMNLKNKKLNRNLVCNG